MDPYRFLVMFAKSYIINWSRFCILVCGPFGHVAATAQVLQLLLLHARSMKHAQPLIKAVLSMLLALSTLKLHSQIAGPKIPKAHLGAFELESLQKYLALTKLKTTNFERLQVAFDGLLWSPAQWRWRSVDHAKSSTCLGNHAKSSIFHHFLPQTAEWWGMLPRNGSCCPGRWKFKQRHVQMIETAMEIYGNSEKMWKTLGENLPTIFLDLPASSGFSLGEQAASSSSETHDRSADQKDQWEKPNGGSCETPCLWNEPEKVLSAIKWRFMLYQTPDQPIRDPCQMPEQLEFLVQQLLRTAAFKF